MYFGYTTKHWEEIYQLVAANPEQFIIFTDPINKKDMQRVMGKMQFGQIKSTVNACKANQLKFQCGKLPYYSQHVETVAI